MKVIFSVTLKKEFLGLKHENLQGFNLRISLPVSRRLLSVLASTGLDFHQLAINGFPATYATKSWSFNRMPAFSFLSLSYFANFTRCNRKAFNTTDTELNAIAAPATQGASSPNAAIGMPSVL